MKKILTFAFSVAMFAVTLYGLSADDEFWRRAALGITWALSILGILTSNIALGDKGEDVRKVLADRPLWRKYLFRSLDIPVAILLAGHGYWWTFGVFVTHAFFSLGAELKADEEAATV